MSTAAVQVQYEEDFFDPSQFFETSASDLEPRFIFFAGDVLSPARKRELPKLLPGGDEHPARCLAPTRGYIRRGKIVPLVRSMEQVGQDEVASPQLLQDIEYRPEANNAGNPGTSVRRMSGLMRAPGQDIASVTEQELVQEQRKGVLEIPILRGVDYKTADYQKLDALFFGNPASLFVNAEMGLRQPIKLAAMQKRINEIKQTHGTNRTVADIAQVMLTSCEMFELWGRTKIEAENLMIRRGTTPGGFTHTYSPLAMVLFDLLELQPLEMVQKAQSAAQFADAAGAAGANNELITLMLEESRAAREQQQATMEMQMQMMQQNADMLKLLHGSILQNAEGNKAKK